MAIETMVAMHVADEQLYAQYREAMRPLLEEYGGGFSYDIRVAETLRSPETHPITRVFVIRFPDTRAQKDFFSHPEYLDARERFFDTAVPAYTEVGTWESVTRRLDS